MCSAVYKYIRVRCDAAPAASVPLLIIQQEHQFKTIFKDLSESPNIMGANINECWTCPVDVRLL